MILAGDVGGTKVNLAFYKHEGQNLIPAGVQSYPSQQFTSLQAVLDALKRDRPETIDAAAFGIAGPVVNDRCKVTNLQWDIDAAELRAQLGVPVGLLNDMEATAYGMLQLRPEERVVLQKGVVQERAAIGVIAAGTGLGECALVWDGYRYRAMPSEGGHADFAPRNLIESDLLAFLLKRHDHVSCERLLSGSGVHVLYEFLLERSRKAAPVWLKEEMAKEDPAAVVSRAAMAGKDPTCREALDLFVRIYGSEAGNIALKFLARGGVYVGGGIAPKILASMTSGAFVDAFNAKGRFVDFMKQIPVVVITNDRIALVGAAHYAKILLTQSTK